MKLTDIFGSQIETMSNNQVNRAIDEYILYIKQTVKNINNANKKRKKNSIYDILEISDIKLEDNIFIYYNEKTKKHCIKNRSINELKSLKRR